RDEPPGQPHGLVPVAGLADHLDVILGVEQSTEPGPDQDLVVSEQDPDHVVPFRGSRARTLNPPPWRGPAKNSPPSAATRSRIPTITLPEAGCWRASEGRTAWSTWSGTYVKR